MAEAAINLTAGQKADRKLDMIFVNVGGSGTETWELLGRGVEDASVEYNHDTDTVTDILGITDVNVSAAKPELDLDPCTIRGGQKLSAKLLDIERRKRRKRAEHVRCAARPLLPGGCFRLLHGGKAHRLHHRAPEPGRLRLRRMPMNVHLSNNKTLGTCTIAAGVPTFTEE